jgi:cis-3-alkyl-4-acyloxetan-2-one decarboxylase
MAQSVAVDGIEVHVEGEGAESIVMVHGWPDTHRLWDDTVVHLKDRYRCIRFTLPGFDVGKPRRAFSIDEVAEFIRHVIEQIAPGRKAILLLHDWGCGFGYQFYARYPQLVSRIVGVDIGDTRGLQRALPRRQAFLILAYQWWLSLAWRVGGRLGDRMSLQMKRWMRSPSDERFIGSHMTYPYYRTWFGGPDNYGPQWRRFTPECPMLFVHARRKPVMFHTQAWIDWLRTKPHNGVVEFDTGHWIMLQQPERFNQTVENWLSATAVS